MRIIFLLFIVTHEVVAQIFVRPQLCFVLADYERSDFKCLNQVRAKPQFDVKALTLCRESRLRSIFDVLVVSCSQLLHFSGSAGAETHSLMALTGCLDAATVAMVTMLDKTGSRFFVFSTYRVFCQSRRGTFYLPDSQEAWQRRRQEFSVQTEVWRLDSNY